MMSSWAAGSRDMMLSPAASVNAPPNPSMLWYTSCRFIRTRVLVVVSSVEENRQGICSSGINERFPLDEQNCTSQDLGVKLFCEKMSIIYCLNFARAN